MGILNVAVKKHKLYLLSWSAYLYNSMAHKKMVTSDNEDTNLYWNKKKLGKSVISLTFSLSQYNIISNTNKTAATTTESNINNILTS